MNPKINLLSLMLAGCTSAAPASLPHRAPAELFPQAISPPAECPGQIAMLIDIENNEFFVYCAPIEPEL